MVCTIGVGVGWVIVTTAVFVETIRVAVGEAIMCRTGDSSVTTSAGAEGVSVGASFARVGRVSGCGGGEKTTVGEKDAIID